MPNQHFSKILPDIVVFKDFFFIHYSIIMSHDIIYKLGKYVYLKNLKQFCGKETKTGSDCCRQLKWNAKILRHWKSEVVP